LTEVECAAASVELALAYAHAADGEAGLLSECQLNPRLRIVLWSAAAIATATETAPVCVAKLLQTTLDKAPQSSLPSPRPDAHPVSRRRTHGPPSFRSVGIGLCRGAAGERLNARVNDAPYGGCEAACVALPECTGYSEQTARSMRCFVYGAGVHSGLSPFTGSEVPLGVFSTLVAWHGDAQPSSAIATVSGDRNFVCMALSHPAGLTAAPTASPLQATTLLQLSSSWTWRCDTDCAASTCIIQPPCRDATLSGGLPLQIGSLTCRDRIVSISLPGTYLNGKVPASLGELFALTELALNGNALSGSLPPTFSRLSRLGKLDLGDNKLTGTLPGFISLFTSLSVLRLANNAFAGTVPQGVTALTMLQELVLGGNRLSGALQSIEGISRMKLLKVVDVSRNKLTGTFLSGITALTELRELKLNDNSIRGTVPVAISALRWLALLDLSQNALEGPFPAGIVALTNLQQLYLRGNELTGTVPAKLSKLIGLEKLDLGQNAFDGLFPEGVLPNRPSETIAELGGLTSATIRLAELRLDGNRFTGLLPAVRIGYATTLSVLELSGNALEGSLPATISRLTKLKTLRAFNNRLEGPVPPALEGMRIAELQLFPQQGCRGSELCKDEANDLNNCTIRKIAGECTNPNGHIARLSCPLSCGLCTNELTTQLARVEQDVAASDFGRCVALPVPSFQRFAAADILTFSAMKQASNGTVSRARVVVMAFNVAGPAGIRDGWRHNGLGVDSAVVCGTPPPCNATVACRTIWLSPEAPRSCTAAFANVSVSVAAAASVFEERPPRSCWTFVHDRWARVGTGSHCTCR
jgi:Leucine-rich repeat (LRR) protein